MVPTPIKIIMPAVTVTAGIFFLHLAALNLFNHSESVSRSLGLFLLSLCCTIVVAVYCLSSSTERVLLSGACRPVPFYKITIALLLCVLLAWTVNSFVDGARLNQSHSEAATHLTGLTLITNLLFAPVYEEVLFRHILFTRLERVSESKAVTGFLTTLLFVALHGQYNVLGLLMVAFYGVVLVTIKFWSNSLLLVIGCHALINASVLFVP